MAKAVGRQEKGACLLCLKRFDLSSDGTDKIMGSSYERQSDLYKRFLNFSSRYLKLTLSAEVFLKAMHKHGQERGGRLQAFCEGCGDTVGYICDLYAELQTLKLRLIWKLEEMDEEMTLARRNVSLFLFRGVLKILMEQLKVPTMTRVEQFRKMFQIKCRSKGKNVAPRVMVPKGLFSEYWKFANPACKTVLMRLIVIFTLASSSMWVATVKKKESVQIRKPGPHRKTVTQPSNNENRGANDISLVKAEVDFDTQNIGEVLEENVELNIDSDWSADGDSSTPLSPAGLCSDAEFEPDRNVLDPDPEVPVKRWNLRKRNRRPVVDFGESDSDQEEDENADKTVDRKDLDLNGSTATNCAAKNRRGWPRHVDCEPSVPCPKCNKMLLDKRCLASHLIQVHDTRLTYSCSNCGEKFTRWKDLRNHKRDKHRQKPNLPRWSRQAKTRKCTFCSKTFITLAKLAAHHRECESRKSIRTAASRTCSKAAGRPSKPTACTVCSETFPSYKAMWIHYRQQHQQRIRKKERKCPHCDEVFPSLQQVRNHRKEVHSELFKNVRTAKKEATCNICEQVFASGAQLLVHRRQTHRRKAGRPRNSDTASRVEKLPEFIREFKCSKCDKIFPTDSEIRKHRLEQHPNARKVRTFNINAKRETKCTLCPEIFPSIKLMVDHLRQHPEYTELKKCPKCFAGFLTSEDLGKHKVEIHNLDGRKHECHICYRTVQGRLNFKAHLEAHESNTIKTRELWFCEVCGRHLYQASGLKNHMLQAHNNVFSCSICKAEVESGKLLRDHLVEHEKPEKFFHCMVCFRGFSSQQYYDLHRKIAHKDYRRHHCDFGMCNEIFDSVELLNEHLNQHAEECRQKGDAEGAEVNICKLCGKGFSQRYNFTMHGLTHTPHNVGRVGYDCPLCQATVRYMETLLTHYNRAHGLKLQPCKCHVCGKAFGNPTSYRLHMLNCGENVMEDSHQLCNICGLDFSNREELNKHKFSSHKITLRAAQKALMLQCPEPGCPEMRTKGKMNYHLAKAHGKGERYPCEVCGKSFINQSYIAEHMESHLPRKYSCDICGKGFKKPSHVTRHKERHQENREKNFMCQICGKNFYTKKGLLFHSYDHMDNSERPHKCQYCGRGYGRKTLWRLHEQTCAKQHGVEVDQDKDKKAKPRRKPGRKPKRIEVADAEEMSERSTTDDEGTGEEEKQLLQISTLEKPFQPNMPLATYSGSFASTEALNPTSATSSLSSLPVPVAQVAGMSYDNWLGISAAMVQQQHINPAGMQTNE